MIPVLAPALFMPKAVATGFVGVGNIKSGASLFAGFRAYTLAGIGGNCANVRRNGDNATQIFPSIAGGGVDTAAIGTFLAGGGSTAGLVITEYDQSGNSRDATQPTAGSQPTLAGAGFLGSTGVSAQFIGGGDTLPTTLSLSNASPFTIFVVIQTPSSAGPFNMFGGNTPSTGFSMDMNAGNFRLLQQAVALIGNFTTAAAASTNYALAASYDGTNYAFYRNGAADGSGVTPLTVPAVAHGIGAGNNPWNGLIGETVVYPSICTPTEVANIHANQRAWFGF
jgi:hypothetical protein